MGAVSSRISRQRPLGSSVNQREPDEDEIMDLVKTARIAGFLYLCVFLTGIFSLIYVPSHIYAAGDAASTVRNIVESDPLFRLGIASELVGHAIFLILPLALYKLLGRVNREAAVLMVAFAVISVPLDFVININKLDVLTLLSGPDYTRALSSGDLQARVMLSLKSYDNGILVCKLFWGLWLLPFGYLVFKSGFLPRTLGVLLMLGCLGYLIDFGGQMLFPGYAHASAARFIRLPAAFGELGICLWLLIMGAKERKPSVG
ncbi:MAG: DUF4386 domain-containing protein [Dokdonella sp.]